MYFLSQAMDPTRRATVPLPEHKPRRRVSRCRGPHARHQRIVEMGGSNGGKILPSPRGKKHGALQRGFDQSCTHHFLLPERKNQGWEVVRRASAAPPDDEPFPPPLLSKSPSFSQSCGGSRPWSKKGNLQRTLDTNKSGCCALLLAGGRRIYF